MLMQRMRRRICKIFPYMICKKAKGVQEGQRIDVGAVGWLILLYLCSCGYLNYLKIVYEHLI